MDKANLKQIIKDSKQTLKMARKKEIDSHPKIEEKIHRVAGNIRSIKVEVRRLKA